MRIALVTERRYEATTAADGDWYLGNILADDRLLMDALVRRGVESVRVDWSRTGVDWSGFDAAVVRTTWDYFDRPVEFRQWLTAASLQTRLINTRSLIEWNFDKHYFSDLSKRGVNIVSSHFIERGDVTPLSQHLIFTGWDNAVIKPCVSGAARHTYRVNAQNSSEIDEIIQPLIKEESFILQPFQQSIVDFGETTLMIFGGKYTHAVRKVAKPGDFRVQDDHGGKVYPYTPDVDEIAFAERAVAACPELPIYARVDLVRDTTGHFAVMELELIEPELWIRFHPPCAELFAESLMSILR